MVRIEEMFTMELILWLLLLSVFMLLSTRPKHSQVLILCFSVALGLLVVYIVLEYILWITQYSTEHYLCFPKDTISQSQVFVEHVNGTITCNGLFLKSEYHTPSTHRNRRIAVCIVILLHFITHNKNVKDILALSGYHGKINPLVHEEYIEDDVLQFFSPTECYRLRHAAYKWVSKQLDETRSTRKEVRNQANNFLRVQMKKQCQLRRKMKQEFEMIITNFGKFE